AEGRRLRLPAVRAAALPVRGPSLAAAAHPAVGRRHPVRRDRLGGAEGPEEARGVLIRRAYGLCHARHLRPEPTGWCGRRPADAQPRLRDRRVIRSEEHTSELQSRFDIVCRLLLEKKNKKNCIVNITNSVNSGDKSGINTMLHELNLLFTINVTMMDIQSNNVYIVDNSDATTL